MSEPAWSYSALSSFETCPRRHFHLRVLKDVREVEGEAARFGKRVHKAFEERVARGAPLPPELMAYEPLLARICRAPGEIMAEQQTAITKDFRRTEWFAKDVWLRVVIDLCIISNGRAFIADYKTGKPGDEFDQLELTAATVMTLHPEVQEVTVVFIWLKTQTLSNTSYTREDVPGVWQKYIERIKPYQQAHAENKWPAKPNGLCARFCPVTFCPHNGKRY